MKELYELKDKLCEELKHFSSRDLNSAALQMVDQLAHAAKNVGKLIEMCEEEEYSERGSYRGMSGRDMSGRDMSGRGMSNMGSYADNGSFARGRNAKRDSMGRYARDGYSRDMVEELRDIAVTLPSDKRESIERLIMQMG